MVEARASSEVQNAEDELVELNGESGRKSEPQEVVSSIGMRRCTRL